MIVRKNAKSLNDGEKKAFIDALLILKKKGRYDEYVHWHHAVMDPAILPYEPRDPDYRNGAHRGPIFLPWHREMLMQVEADLQAIDPSISIPYWDWTQDAAQADSSDSAIWREDFMGGNGVPTDNWVVATGPFAYAKGNWPIPKDHDGPALRRHFGSTVPNLPSADDLVFAMREAYYDTPPFNSTPFTVGFRNRLEGWVTQRGDARVKTTGSQLHNRVHLWVGGSMEPMTSPNDPIFFLHHSFIDKVWADWQALQEQENPAARPHYAPELGGPPGHNIDDQLKPWKRTARQVLDISALGYSYEQTSTHSQLLRAASRGRMRVGQRSPFFTE